MRAGMPKDISVIIVTKNEERRLDKCLKALCDFDHIVVVDSKSADKTQEIAKAFGAEVVNFIWNGQYPKKRQWVLDNLQLRDWVLFIDADEIMTPALAEEIFTLRKDAAGYFIRGQYVYKGRMLRFGLRNNKLALINRHKMMFPVVDDLNLPGMGEIEGHYQPVLKDVGSIGQLQSALIHEAYDQDWLARHERYAAWGRGMNAKRAWPDDFRFIKRVFRTLPFKPFIAFLHSYILKLGFLDGIAGLQFALSRARYYTMISKPSKATA